VEDDVRDVDARFALALALELLPQLKEPVFNFIFNVWIKLLLSAN
jgi:hypothetical protein